MNITLYRKEVIDMNNILILSLCAMSFFGGIIIGAIWMGEAMVKDVIKLLNKDKES